MWTWGSNIAGELGIGDNEPKLAPYPVMALKNKRVTQVACGSSFIVALGSNLKKELPGLKLNMKKVTSLQRRHRRNTEDINISAAKKSGSRSQERSKSSVTQSGKKRVKSFSRYAKGNANGDAK